MKADIHPQYSEVLFHHIDAAILSSKCRDQRSETLKGRPRISPWTFVASSHPFYTGKQKVAQSDGRVARFNKRFGDRSLKG